MSSIYDASAMSGIFIASILVALVSSQGDITQSWRALYWIGASVSVFGIFLRLRSKETDDFLLRKRDLGDSFLTIFKEQKSAICCIAIASGFSYTTYIMSFTFMNGYIPLISTISKAEVVQINTYLLLLDMLLLPLFGWIAHRIGKEKLMLYSSFGLSLFAIPSFYFLGSPTLASLIFVRLVIVVAGVAFASVYHAWAIEQVPAQHRFTILGLGTALGAQCIGTPACAISLWLFQTTGASIAPAFYLAITSLAAGFVVVYSYKKRFVQKVADEH